MGGRTNIGPAAKGRFPGEREEDPRSVSLRYRLCRASEPGAFQLLMASSQCKPFLGWCINGLYRIYFSDPIFTSCEPENIVRAVKAGVMIRHFSPERYSSSRSPTGTPSATASLSTTVIVGLRAPRSRSLT